MSIFSNLYIQIVFCILTFIAIYFFIRANSETETKLNKHKKN